MNDIILSFIRDFFFSAAAGFFFGAAAARVPWKPLIPSCIAGGLVYLIYRIMTVSFDREILGYALAAIIAGFLSEIFARVFRHPATIFVIPSVIVLVPGVTLYNAMYALVQGNTAEASNLAMKAILFSGIIAAGIAVTGSIVKHLIKLSAKKSR